MMGITGDSGCAAVTMPDFRGNGSLACHLLRIRRVSMHWSDEGRSSGLEDRREGDARRFKKVRRLNDEEVQAFIHNDSKAMAWLWSDGFGTNPLNKFVTNRLEAAQKWQSLLGPF
jgi:DNA-binding transcriptional ArsR family regulator